MPADKNIGEAVTVLIPSHLSETVWNAVADAGHEKTGAGLLLTFLDMNEELDEIEDAPRAPEIVEHLLKHPEQVDALKRLGKTVGRSMLNTLLGRKG